MIIYKIRDDRIIVLSVFNTWQDPEKKPGHRYYREALDADFSLLDALSIFNNYGSDWNKVEVLTQELRFSSPGTETGPLEWTAGAYLFYQHSPVKQATLFGEDAGVMGVEDSNFALVNTMETTGTGAAVYGQATYSFSEGWDLTLGLRYDHEHKEQSVHGEYRKEEPPTSFEFRKDSLATAHFTALSPTAGLTYHLSEDRLAYVTYSRGFRAGGLTPLSTDPSQPPLHEYRPEYSENFELGSKNAFLDRKLYLNLALFYTLVRDVQVPRLLLPDAVTIIRNTGELSSKGAELELRTRLLRELDLSYSFGYTHAEYGSLTLAANQQEVELEGNRQIFTPEFTSTLALQYRQQLGKTGNWELQAGAEWKFLGTQYFDLANTIEQEPYSLVDGRLGMAYKNLSFSLWGRNLFEETFIGYAYDFGAVHLGTPRILGGSLSFRR